MPLFLCRWPNGDFSIVSAADPEDAVIQLDEWGNAEIAQLWEMNSCMVDFRLNDAGEIELSETPFGEDTIDEIMGRCFPQLQEVLQSRELRSPETGEYTEAADQVILEAVERERKRQTVGPAPEADTEIGRYVQRVIGAPSALVNRMVMDVSEKLMDALPDEQKKPN